MQKQLLTLALLLFATQTQALSKEVVEVDSSSASSSSHLPFVKLEQTEQLQQPQTSRWSNLTLGGDGPVYSLVSPAKDEVEASRFLLETPITSCISLVEDKGTGPQACHPANHNANSFIDFQDSVPSLIDYTFGDTIPIEIIDQRHGFVDFKIKQDWVNAQVPAFSIFYRNSADESTCDTYANVTNGQWEKHYTAKCYFTKAEVKLYMRFCEKENEVRVNQTTGALEYCETPPDGDLTQYKELSFEINCDPACGAVLEGNGFNPYDLPCEDEDTEQLDGFLGDGVVDCEGNLVPVDDDNLPIRVVERSRDGETVVFELTQDYYNGTIVKWGVHHRANATFQDCDVEHDIAYNETRQFTTKCWYGQAAVTLYVYMCELEPHDDCDVCSAPESLDNYMQYAYNIACYRPCDNDTDILLPSEPPTPAPSEDNGTEPPEDAGDDPELPGPENNCTKLVSVVGNGGSTCTVGGAYQSLISDSDASQAIEILSTNNDTVEFKVSQHFVEGEIHRFSLLYDKEVANHDCDTYMDIDYNWEATYTAVCFMEKAAVKFYLRLCQNTEDRECDFCTTPASMDDYIELTVELDCSEVCDPSYVPPTSAPTSAPTGPAAEPTTSSPTSAPTEPAVPAEPTISPPVPDVPGPPGPTPDSPEVLFPDVPGPSGPGGQVGPPGPTPNVPEVPDVPGPSGPTPVSPGVPDVPGPSGPNAPDGSTPVSPDVPDVPGPPGPTPVFPDVPDVPGPPGPSVPDGSTPVSPDVPDEPGPTPVSPDVPDEPGPPGPTPVSPDVPDVPGPIEPRSPPGPTPVSPDVPDEPGPPGPTPVSPDVPDEPGGPPGGPVSNICPELPDPSCPGDVVHVSTTGSTEFSEPPIRILDQTDTTVTFSVDNKFGSVLENVYTEYYALADGTASCRSAPAVGLCAADGISYVAHCTGERYPRMTLVDMFVSDPSIFDSVTDNAIIPSTCGAGGGSSTVKYTFALYCQSTCPVLSSRRLRGASQAQN